MGYILVLWASVGVNNQEGLAFAFNGIGMEKNLEMKPTIQNIVNEFQHP